MKTHVVSLSFAFFLLTGGLATAGSWIDSYWPLNDGDFKTFFYSGTSQLTMNTTDNGGGEYEISVDSPDGWAAEYYENTGPAVTLDHADANSGWIHVYLDPPVLLMSDTMLQNGGSASTSTTVSQQGVSYPATYTIAVSLAGTVVVPAGSFANCRNITVTEKATVPGQGTVTVNAMTAVLAPSVGIIRKLVSQGVWANLVSGTVGGTDVGVLASGPPALTIQTPANGQRIATGDNNVAVAGSVRGYSPGMQVFYQVNSGTWASALVAGTNWSGSVQAQPGTNLINAYALDSVGRQSPTVGAVFQFVVTGVLSVLTIGKGSISPNYSNAVCEIGRAYTITATPAAGYAFTNWTAQVEGNVVLTTNKAALNFVMQSNLVLTATFVDVQKPVLTITAPTMNQRWSNAMFTVAGKVTDNGPAGAVWCQLNGGLWNMASGWSNWTTGVTLNPGTNTLIAYAVDAAGNLSTNSSRKVVYVVSAPISLIVVGNGTVSGASYGQMLELGKSVALTAKPATGCVLTNWLVTVDNATVLSTNKAVPFLMQSNLVLTATFVDVMRPTNTITAPVNGQRWSNAVFIVKGTAHDNVQVSNVWFQINGSGWQSGTTTNHWTNWTTVVTLMPGTNTVQAYAVDTSGNSSPINRATVNYVKTFALADYYPLRAGAQWLYTGSGPDSSSFLSSQVVDTNYSVTDYTGSDPAKSYTTNSVKVAKSYLDAGMNVLESWTEYEYAGPSYGSYGDDEIGGSFRVDRGVAFPAQMAIGSIITGTGNAYSSGVYFGTASVTLKLLENTSLTVPAGTFPDVLHLRATFAVTGNKTQVRDWWWAKSVGQIKHLGLTNDTASWELASYSAPGALLAPPVIQSRDGSLGFSANQFGFHFSGQSGQVVIVEASTDLVNWQPVQTNTVAGVPVQFSDSQWTNHPSRFYRLRSP